MPSFANLPTMAAFTWLPDLYKPEDTFTVVYNRGSPRLTAKMKANPNFNLLLATSMKALERYLYDTDV